MPQTGDVLKWVNPTDPEDPSVEWGPVPGGSPALTVTDETTYGITPAVGVSLRFAREDHTHGTPQSGGGGNSYFPSGW